MKTREEQRAKAAHEYIQSDSVVAGNEILAFGDFINGAKWADFHPQWIPVKERLPPRAENSFIFSELVLVCDNIGYMDTAWYNFEKNRWEWLNNVTHWMPLPMPPQGKEDKK